MKLAMADMREMRWRKIVRVRCPSRWDTISKVSLGDTLFIIIFILRMQRRLGITYSVHTGSLR